ncbi:efflux RND transporter periplasmic adaptor subunit [Methylocella sp.]|uniref:efflux RND transporter periplasmic adaptor subunit n=1 Tax=Methylocella sp. TaxID=1978226 RepID=UPI0037830A55
MDDRSRPAAQETTDTVYMRAEDAEHGLKEAERTREAPGAPPAAPGPTEPKKSPLKRAILILLAGVIAFGAYRFITRERSASEQPPERISVSQPVGAATVGRGDVRVIVNGLGAVNPLATATVKTQVNGQLTEVAFKEGQIVKKGDFLAQVDPRPFEIAKAQYEGQLARDQGLLDQARNNMQRFQSLLKQDSIARQTAEDQVYLVKQYEGALKADQALIDAQALNLVYAHIVSPIDGRIGLRLVDVGNYVQTSDSSGIAVVTQLDPISVIFTVAEDELPAILEKRAAGAQMEVSLFDRANVRRLAVGKLDTLDNQIDATTGTLKLRAIFDNPDGRLYPNQFVNAQLLVDLLKDAVTVPTTAIQRGAPGAYVYLIGADGKVSIRKVKLGPQDSGRFAVLEGLSPGDRVVVDGVDRLRDGAEISIAALDGKPVDAPRPAGAAGQHRRRSASPPP